MLKLFNGLLGHRIRSCLAVGDGHGDIELAIAPSVDEFGEVLDEYRITREAHGTVFSRHSCTLSVYPVSDNGRPFTQEHKVRKGPPSSFGLSEWQCLSPDDQVVRKVHLCGSKCRDFEQRSAYLHDR